MHNKDIKNVDKKYPELFNLLAGNFHEDAEGSIDEILQPIFTNPEHYNNPQYKLRLESTLQEINLLLNETGYTVSTVVSALGARHIPLQASENKSTTFLNKIKSTIEKELKNIVNNTKS